MIHCMHISFSDANAKQSYILMYKCNREEQWKLWHISCILELVMTWWRHDMETLCTLLALCKGNPQPTGGSPHKWASNVALLGFFYNGLNKLLNIQSSFTWIYTPWQSRDVTSKYRYKCTHGSQWYSNQAKIYLSTLYYGRENPCINIQMYT